MKQRSRMATPHRGCTAGK